MQKTIKNIKLYSQDSINIATDVLESATRFLNTHSCDHVFDVTYNPDNPDNDEEYKAEKIAKMRQGSLAANLANLWPMLDSKSQENFVAAVLEYRNRNVRFPAQLGRVEEEQKLARLLS